MIWITYNTITGGIISTHEIEPSVGSGQSKAWVNFIFGDAELWIYKWNGTQVVRNDSIWIKYDTITGVILFRGSEEPALNSGESKTTVDHVFNLFQPINFWKHENGLIVENTNITEAEPTDTLDVDLSGVLPANSLLKYNGEKWVQYQNYFNYIDSSDQSNWRNNQTTEGIINETTSFETYLELEITPRESGLYKIGCSYVFSKDSTTTDFVSSLNLYTGATLTKSIYNQVLEVKESGSSGDNFNTISNGLISFTQNVGTDQKILSCFNDYVQLLKNQTYFIRLEWRSKQTGVESAIHKGNISCEQKILTP